VILQRAIKTQPGCRSNLYSLQSVRIAACKFLACVCMCICVRACVRVRRSVYRAVGGDVIT
jgi:hypothetical protein